MLYDGAIFPRLPSQFQLWDEPLLPVGFDLLGAEFHMMRSVVQRIAGIASANPEDSGEYAISIRMEQGWQLALSEQMSGQSWLHTVPRLASRESETQSTSNCTQEFPRTSRPAG